MQEGRNLARGAAVIYRYLQGEERPQARISTTFFRRGKAQDRDPDSGVEARREFWSTIGNHINRNHVAPRTKLFVPQDDCPIPLKYIVVQRQTKTNIDVLREATIDDYWNIDGDKSLSEPCVTRFEQHNKEPPKGHMWVQGRLTKKQVTARPEYIWPAPWSIMSKNSQRKAISKWAEEKQKTDAARDDGEEKIGNQKCQRYLAKSPNQSTRTAQAWSDPVQVIGLSLTRKD